MGEETDVKVTADEMDMKGTVDEETEKITLDVGGDEVKKTLLPWK